MEKGNEEEKDAGQVYIFLSRRCVDQCCCVVQVMSESVKAPEQKAASVLRKLRYNGFELMLGHS